MDRRPFHSLRLQRGGVDLLATSWLMMFVVDHKSSSINSLYPEYHKLFLFIDSDSLESRSDGQCRLSAEDFD